VRGTVYPVHSASLTEAARDTQQAALEIPVADAGCRRALIVATGRAARGAGSRPAMEAAKPGTASEDLYPKIRRAIGYTGSAIWMSNRVSISVKNTPDCPTRMLPQGIGFALLTSSRDLPAQTA
jgi:hypothetical protein